MWRLILPSGESKAIDLPYSANVKANENLVLERYLKYSFPEGMSLRLRSSMQYIVVSIGGNVIFDNTDFVNSGPFFAPEVSAWHIVELPPESAGRMLRISIQSPVQKMAGKSIQYTMVFTATCIAILFTVSPSA
jgi:hypothetical protein